MRKSFTFITNSKGWCKADKIDCLMIGSLKAGASRNSNEAGRPHLKGTRGWSGGKN
jgi:hypothetical protein